MKKHLLAFILTLLLVSGSQVLNAQNKLTLQRDSIPVEDVFRFIEDNSPYRVYSTIDPSTIVHVNAVSQDPMQLLISLFSETDFQVSLYDNNLYVLNGKLVTSYSRSLGRSRYIPGDPGSLLTQGIRIEKATSENKVYNIGDPYTRKPAAFVNVSGKVTDFKTGDPMIGINLIVKDPWIATTTGSNGQYSLRLPAGRVQLEISGMNVKESRRQLMLYSDGEIDIELEEEDHLLDEILITSGRIQNVKSTQIGMERLQVSRIKNIPTALGEVDLLRAIQTLPGVKTVGEASSGFNVRGGATDQNLILLNDGTIYNPNHLFGFFSAFSSDMIKEAEIYKSSIPSKYGGRISSVLDITAKEANKEKFTGSAGIGLVTSKLNLEIPVIKQKSSLLLSGRTTYSDWILGALPKKSGYNDGKAGFYDLGGVYSHSFGDKHNLNVFGYYSHDRFSFNENEKYAYNNMNASAKWRSIFNDKLIGYFTVGYDHYDYKNQESTNEIEAFELSFDINQMFAKADFTYSLNDKHTLDMGFKTLYYDINAGKVKPVGTESQIKGDVLQKDKALESAFYIGDQWEVTSQLSVNAGIRYSVFNALGPKTYNTYQDGMLPSLSTITGVEKIGSGKVIQTYHGPEFRLSARYAFTDDFSVKAGFNSMRQYIHKLSNTAVMSPTDTWKLSDANIKPQRGWQAAAGLYMNSPRNIWEYSLEGYYKKMNDYLDYRSGAKIIMNHHIETDVIRTEGHSYGVELSVKKVAGKLNGWVSYTYSRTFLRQNDKMIEKPVNNGDWYPTEYDKPHDFKLVGNYKFTERYSMSVNVDYSTGRPTTIPAGQYFDKELNSMRVYYTDRNSYRIPDYFRTDISFNIEPSHKLTLLTHSSISIGVYNVTGRKNVYSIYYLAEDGKIQGYKMSIFGTPIPFITYNIRF